MNFKNRQTKQLLFFLTPPYLWLIIFFIAPLIIILFYSVSSRGVYGGVKLGLTLEHYKSVFTAVYVRIMFSSLLTAFVTTIITLFLALPIAYFMAFASPKIKMLCLFLIVIPFWTNFLIRLYSFIILLSDNGILNSVLLKIGFIHKPLQLLNNYFAVYLGLIYCNLPFMIIPIFSALDKMDSSYIESSMDLGANHLITFKNIVLPQAMPGIIAGVVFVFIPTIGNFMVPDILGGPDTYMIGNVITAQFTSARNWPLGSAFSSALIFVVMIFVALYIRYYDPAKNKKTIDL